MSRYTQSMSDVAAQSIVLFAIVTACDKESPADVAFPCGSDTCHSPTQFCEIVSYAGGVMDSGSVDGSLTTASCHGMPAQCTTEMTCACLADAGLTGGCGNTKCGEQDGAVTVNQYCGL
jgi:hypothetical protein